MCDACVEMVTKRTLLSRFVEELSVCVKSLGCEWFVVAA